MGKSKNVNALCECGSGLKYKKCCKPKNDEYNLKKPLYDKQKLLVESYKPKNYDTIIGLGEVITDSEYKHDFLTGTYANIARAQFYKWEESGINRYLELSKDNCDKSLHLKDTNLSSLSTLLTVQHYLNEYDGILDRLKNITDSVVLEKIYELLTKWFLSVSSFGFQTDFKNIHALRAIAKWLLDTYGRTDLLCGVLIDFYIGLGDDYNEAYSLVQSFLDNNESAQMYSKAAFICLNYNVEKYEKAIEYCEKGLNIVSEYNDTISLKTHYAVALGKCDENEKAESIFRELLALSPSNVTYYNYAMFLLDKNEADNAIDWLNKSLFIAEDELSLLSLSKAYEQAEQFDKAVEYSKKAIININNGNLINEYSETNGTSCTSGIAPTSVNFLKLEAYKKIISILYQIKKSSEAKIYLDLGIQDFPHDSSLKAWNQTLPDIEYLTQEYDSTLSFLNDVRDELKYVKYQTREWSIKLIELQNNYDESDIGDGDNWNDFSEKMDNIIFELKNSIINETELRNRILQQVNLDYSTLDVDAKEFLITANMLYEIHENSTIDFAPIIVEYSKVVEKQLRILLSDSLPQRTRMLGQIIGYIRDENILPYSAYYNDLKEVNDLRKISAHTGQLTKIQAIEMRTILFNNNLLNKLL